MERDDDEGESHDQAGQQRDGDVAKIEAKQTARDVDLIEDPLGDPEAEIDDSARKEKVGSGQRHPGNAASAQAQNAEAVDDDVGEEQPILDEEQGEADQ